jgi:sugar transferase (PEP-CTERM/EpsH1 system associated)
LVVVSRFPYPLEKGDKLRAYYQIKELSKHYKVTLFSLSDKKISPQQLGELQKYCDKVIIHRLTWWSIMWNITYAFLTKKPLQVGYFYSKTAKRKINLEIKSSTYKHIYCQLVRCAEYVKEFHEIPKSIDYMDVLSIGIKRRIDSQRVLLRWIFKREFRTLQAYERNIFDYFENKTIISEQDRSLISHHRRNEIVIVPNGIDRSFVNNELAIKQDHELVFVGNMSYPPNIEAVKYIAEHILAKNSELKLLVSGSSPHTSIKKLAESSDQITLTGWVDDIRTSYLRGKIFIAPMTIGTGMQNKLLEAMALGIPCITTPLANNAIKAKHNKEILESSSPEDFNELIKQLLSNEEQRIFIGQNGSNFVRDNYSWEKTTSLLTDRIEKGFK